MLKRPSARTRRHSGQLELNLIPILDSLVTLISFLMLTMSVMNVVSIESPFPIVSQEDIEQKLKDPKDKPLQLTISMRESELEVWSPFGKVPSKSIPYKDGTKPDTTALHETLMAIKKQFPDENKVVIVPTAKTDYDSLIILMDAIRVLEKSDIPIFRKNPTTGIDEPVKVLFPEVVFGNLLGDT